MTAFEARNGLCHTTILHPGTRVVMLVILLSSLGALEVMLALDVYGYSLPW
jgi:hypothetical protein